MRNREVEQGRRVCREILGREGNGVEHEREVRLESAVEQPFLASEVGVDQLLVGAGSGRDPVDARPSQPVLRELGGSRLADALPCRGGVTDSHDHDNTPNQLVS
jgi:hypothetical protein